MSETMLPTETECPDRRRFAEDVLTGLSRSPKVLPCKYFYDAQGVELYEQICELEEYYPSRIETELLAEQTELPALIGPDVTLLAYGNGASPAARALLDRLPHLAAYVPIEPSQEALAGTVARLREAYPGLNLVPLCADYTRRLELPAAALSGRRVVYFPGASIGNYHLEAARALLRGIGRVVGPGGGLLMGVDLHKSLDILRPAYDDEEGLTAEFNLNLLRRINRELGADFRLYAFRHQAIFNREANCLELHLVSLERQEVHLAGHIIAFEPGETIHTECAYKYTLPGFAELAASVGYEVERVWTDAGGWYSVQYLTRPYRPAPDVAPLRSVRSGRTR